MPSTRASQSSFPHRTLTLVQILYYIAFFVVTLTTTYQSAKAADIVVNTTDDDFAANGNCTLREAIEAINDGNVAQADACTNASANGFGTNDTIILGSGFYKLTVPQTASSTTTDNHSGDLNIRDHVTIRGAGPGQTVVSAKELLSPTQDRIFVNMLARVVNIEGMTIESGTGDGGTEGILVRNSSASGTLNLRDLVLRDASGLSGAAAVYNNGDMSMSNVAVLQTRGTSAGAIHNNGGTLDMTNVTIAGTTATNNGSGTAGAIYNNDGTLNLTNVTLFENRWGIYSVGVNATTTISNTVLAGNEQNCRGDLTTYVSTGNNWSDDNSCNSIAGFGTHGVDPQLSDLTFATATMNPSGIVTGTIVVPPFDNSPLLAAGTTCATTDQTDAPRAAACTIGAYEGSLPAQAALALTPAAAAGTINGVAYLDHNADGTIGALDPPVGGIVVTAYYAGGSASTVTDSAGQYTLTVPAGAAARVEFTAIPAPLTPGVYGAQSDTSVHFVTSPMDNVNLALTNAATYCQDNPTLATSCYFFGDQSSGEGVLVSFPYDAGASGRDGDSTTGSGGYDNPPHPVLATDNQIGTTWGLAYQRITDRWFAASFMKRHVGLGPTDDAGTIYQLDATGAPTVLTTLAAGANPHPNATADFTLDVATWDAVGKTSLGDMDISTDDQTLYVVNLFDKNLYSVEIASGNSTGAAIPLPTAANLFGAAQGCPTADDVRPFALSVNPNDGLVYVGMVCSAESTELASDLRAYVYTFDGTNFGAAPVLEFALDYERGHAYNSGQSVPGNWLPWEPDPADVLANNLSQVDGRNDLISYPQPLLADIEFDNGDMILSFMDRMGHQHGQCAPFPDGSTPTDGGCNPNGYVVNPAGDLLRACASGLNAWSIEANASCGDRQTAGANNGQGPGGGGLSGIESLSGEYYFMDEMTRAHREVTSGGILQLAGQPDVASIVFDPIIWSNDFFAAGIHWSSNQYGTWQRSYRVFDTIEPFNLNNGIFGKSNGLGDLEAACFAAPIEIGNRVWYDANGDGVQDPDEAPIGGVTVNLYDPSGNLIATTITAADGSYYFSSGPGTDSGNAAYNLSALGFNTAGYTVRLDNPNDYAAGGPLDGIGLTVDNNDPTVDGDLRDSDGTLVNGYPQLSFDTGAPGDNNHTYDFGFQPLDLIVMKSATPSTLLGGELLTYTIRYFETNGLATGAITITEQLPAQVTFLGQESATPAATLDASNPSQPVWFVPQLDHNTIGEIIFMVLVDPTYVGALLNTVEITTTGDMTPTNNADTESTEVVNIGIDVEKSTNGVDADSATGPIVEVGQSVTWSYVVTNTGSYTLTGVTVADDLAGAVSCPSTTLPPAPDPAHVMTCTAIVDVAIVGQYVNVATATGTATIDGTPHPTSDDDPSHYFGSDPEILILKEPALQAVLLGDTATFQIIVENSGNVPLTNVVISDPLLPTCDTTFASLAVGERQSYSCAFSTVTADITNVITATGTPPIGDPVDDSDDADVIITTNEAFALAIDLEKSTNGVDADQAPGPYIEPGQPVTWTYEVVNTGGYTLTNVTLSDDMEGPVSCPTTTLFPTPGPGHSMICTLTNVAVVGPYENSATVGGDALVDGTTYAVTDTDPSHYLGITPGLAITKDPPSQQVVAGGSANFVIRVENLGNVPLTNVQVTDPLAPNCDMTLALLAVGAQHAHSCTMGPLPTAGAITNVASVVGTPPIGPDLTDDDQAEVEVLEPPTDEMPGIAVQKDPPQQTVNSGEVVTFTITLSNTGNVALSNVSVTDPQAPSCDATVAVLPVGQVYSYQCALNGVSASFINTVFASGEAPSGIVVSDNDVAEVEVIEVNVGEPEPPSALSVIKGPANQVVLQGSTATFFVTVINIGQTELSNVTVSDPQAPSCDRVIGALSVGASVSYVCTVEAVQENFTNTIAAAGDSPNGPVSDDDSADVGVTVVEPPPADMPAIALEKVAGTSSLTTGESATFTITVRNTGNVDLSNLVVSDPLLPACDIQLPLLPAGLSFTYRCIDTNVTESYTNQAFVTAAPPTGPTVQDSDEAAVVVTQLASIGDYVWFDENADGIQDPTEMPLPGVRVELLDEDGIMIGITATDVNGRYRFDDLDPGTYSVRVVAPEGYAFSPQNVGLDNLADSDMDASEGTTVPTMLDAGEQDMSWDAGLNRPANVRLQKHSLTTVAAPGEVIIYSLSVTNFGLEAANNMVITETVSLDTTFVADFSTTGWSCADGSAAGTACAFTIESIAPNETMVASFAIRIDADVTPSEVSSIKNTAVIAGEIGVTTDFRNAFTQADFEVLVGVPTSLDLAAEPDAEINPAEVGPRLYLPMILNR